MSIKNNKKKFFFAALLFLGAGLFFFVAPAQAQTGADWAGRILGGMIGWIISALGIIMVLVIKALVAVAQYNSFIDSQAVVNGWRIVRDVCNMFFIVVLLIIAFATILNQEKYSYKTWLPKLILMAILINFSKTICGLFIDVTQVVMLTFVNAFKGMAAGNLISNLGITDIVTLANNNADVGFWAIVGAYFLGLIYMLVALVTIVTMLAMLVMRMVMIWVYVVLSPAAYVMAAFPGGQKYSSMWWTEFSKNLIVGPVLAFFIWLSFVSMQSYVPANDFPGVDSSMTTQSAGSEIGLRPDSSYGKTGPATKAGELDIFLKFIISIGMLIGGLKIASDIGGAAGSIAGKGMSALQKGAVMAGKGAWGVERWGARKLAKTTGIDWRASTLKAGWKAHSEASKMKDETDIKNTAAKHFAAGGIESVLVGTGAGKDYFDRYAEGFLGAKGIARAGKEIFYSPFKRASLGEDIDEKNHSIDMLSKNKEERVGEKNRIEEEHKKAHQEGIAETFDNLVYSDVELGKLDHQKDLNDIEISALEGKKKSGSITSKEEMRLNTLEKDNKDIESSVVDRKSVLEKEAYEKYNEKLGVSEKGMPSMSAFLDEFREKEKRSIELDFNKSFQDLDPDGRMASLALKERSGEKLSKKERSEFSDFRAKRKELENKRDSSLAGIDEKGRKEYVDRVIGVHAVNEDIDAIDVRIKANQQDLNNLKKEILKVQKPTSLGGRSVYRQGIDEAKKKFGGVTNSDELGKAFVDAAQRGDKFDQIAIAEKMSSDGNLNDLLNLRGYSSDAKGLYQFTQGLDNGHGGGDGLKGFSDYERLQVLNDLGESEERVNHWEMAKMIGMNDKGEMESFVKAIKDSTGKITGYDSSRHTAAAFNEIQKMDPQQAVIRLNRLAYGGEDAEGNFHIADLGKLIFKSLSEGGAYEKNESRIQANAAANLMSPDVVPVLKSILSANQKLADSVFASLTKRGGKEGSGKTGSMMSWLEEFNKKSV